MLRRGMESAPHRSVGSQRHAVSASDSELHNRCRNLESRLAWNRIRTVIATATKLHTIRNT
jgi:hypothetical protein